MDKLQKQLIKTYFRKRGMTSNRLGFEDYEINYIPIAIKNNLINSNNLDKVEPSHIAIILIEEPDLIDYFKDKLNKFKPIHIKWVLRNQPSLINYFKDRLNELDSDDIGSILDKQPQLKKYFQQ